MNPIKEAMCICFPFSNREDLKRIVSLLKKVHLLKPAEIKEDSKEPVVGWKCFVKLYNQEHTHAVLGLCHNREIIEDMSVDENVDILPFAHIEAHHDGYVPFEPDAIFWDENGLPTLAVMHPDQKSLDEDVQIEKASPFVAKAQNLAKQTPAKQKQTS
jgi:hypothetical protein